MDFADRVMPSGLIRSDQPHLAFASRHRRLTRFVPDSFYLRALEPNWFLTELYPRRTSRPDVPRYPT